MKITDCSKPRALVCGAGGFIGHHLVTDLKKKGYWVRGVDLKFPRFEETKADDFVIGDLRDVNVVKRVIDCRFSRVYQLAADMGGAGFVFTGDNDADIMHNSALINLNVIDECYKRRVRKIFYSSSACIYPEYAQDSLDATGLEESSAYPADPDSEYGWEKLFSEHLYLSYIRNKGMDVKIARFHNIFGPLGSWNDGREKAPAALCRKIAKAKLHNEHTIDCWGDGEQIRSFLYIDECLEGIEKLMNSDFQGPVNIGSDEKISINGLAEMIMEIADYKVSIVHDLSKPQGVRCRNSDNTFIENLLKWKPKQPLHDGVILTYRWIQEQVHEQYPLIKKKQRTSSADLDMRDKHGR